jgi:hypothetical protein
MKITENFLTKGKEELIQLALDLLKEKYTTIQINRNDYHIKVWKGTNGIAVDFTRIIQYIPLSKAHVKLAYDIVVNLTNQDIIPFSNPTLHGEFYIPASIDLEALAFIKKHFGVFTSQFENAIYEGEEEYHISCDNDSAFGRYTLNKKTGEQGSAIQGSYDQNSKPFVDNDPFEVMD